MWNDPGIDLNMLQLDLYMQFEDRVGIKRINSGWQGLCRLNQPGFG
jgi:hypothetical protein